MPIATNEKPIYARTINNNVGVLNAATAGAIGTTTNAVTCFTAGVNGSRIESLPISTDESATVNILLQEVLSDGTTVIPIGIVSVVANSGNSGSAASVDALLGAGVTLQGLQVDAAGKRFISLRASSTLRASALANMTASKKAWIRCEGYDY